MNHEQHSLSHQIDSLRRYREQASGRQATYLDGAIAALEWAVCPQDYISLAAVCAMGVDPSRPVEPEKAKLELVK